MTAANTGYRQIRAKRTAGGCCQGGFTLLEVLVAIATLAISLTAIYGSQARSLALATEAQFKISASFLARMKLAEIESASPVPGNDDGDFGEEYPGYAWKTEVDEAALADVPLFAGMPAEVLKVTVTVYRRDGGGPEYALQAYVAPRIRE